MNRQQRRAATHQAAHGTGVRETIAALQAEALRFEQQQQFDAAARAYKRLLALAPDHAEAHNNLGRVLQALGKPVEASAAFARALALMPQLARQQAGVYATIAALRPPFAVAVQRQAAAWPRRLDAAELFGPDGVGAIADDALLRTMLRAAPICDVALERLFTALRRILLAAARTAPTADEAVLGFAGALARQCFVNEYVFAATPEEAADVAAFEAALSAGAMPAPLAVAALAMYRPLHTLAAAPALLAHRWPPAIDAVLTQQLREPVQESALATDIARLTAIDDDVSQRVRRQYEENPYPRWVALAGAVTPVAIDHYLRDQFPTAPFTPVNKTETLDVLVAGCGTGQHAIETARKFAGARVLAVDLSLRSLAYAKRMTPAPLAGRIDYAQADILALGALGRDFDVVDASGVLHHMADPFAGWRILLGLVRPGGLMHIGLYSEAARRDVAAARAFIAAGGFTATPEDIRRCRAALLDSDLRGVARYSDFFTTSECRDLLFHVQEHRTAIPALQEFFAAANLRFLGFEFDATARERLRALFAANGWTLGDLGRWHALEQQFPDTFAGMYQFWVQKG